jgi:two-component system response regulator
MTTMNTATLDVIVCDDDHDDQMLVSMAAQEQRAGIDLSFVDTGMELMAELQKRIEQTRLPDLVVLDLRMPVMDGHDVLERMRTDPVLWQIPVVVFTSSASVRDLQRSYARGAIWYETKPSDFGELVEFVARLPRYAAQGGHDPFDADTEPYNYLSGNEAYDDDVLDIERRAGDEKR